MFFFVEPILSSYELDVIQYKISSPGSFAFSEGCDNTVSCNGVNTRQYNESDKISNDNDRKNAIASKSNALNSFFS